ncbi:hypothetical protein KVT40_004379 [Elsinoe batatas]|uniref:Uncharacterized protein n=1 Tax=Elsinoe batatas TaxID=2601811 RepID=A0A8K0L6B6_9PEZI|nr:hypothetical protein KVT40_004379 [Elsinoe batatas]
MITPSDPRISPISFGITLVLVAFSLAREKLTPLGVLTAFSTACLHVSFPSTVPFACLVTFFIAGIVATRVGKAAKSGLTVSSVGGSGVEGPRNAVQVLANSGTASLFILAAFGVRYTGRDVLSLITGGDGTVSTDAALVRRVVFASACSYAAAAADTLSSELGILAKSSPFLLTPPFQKVPRGTNGGVTIEGLGAGLLGGAIIGLVYYLEYRDASRAGAITVLGLGGSLLDSILGAVAQATVEDKSSGRVVEGANGKRALFTTGGSRVRRGRDLLNNNGVNFVMALTIGVAGLVVDRLLN